ncbi:acyltransferase [Actinoplanes sp. NBRC 14428]|nr:acyltransferase [Actinoplanes sp. NBRC 14428]
MKAGFRGDIQGLRAVAVVAVLLWHAELTWLPGGFVGVDVFFVISGYLVTRMLTGQFRETGRLSLTDFYARRARRLLPAACVVLLSTLVLTRLFLPSLRWSDTAWDVLASSLGAVNWRLAARATDYLSQDAAPSIVQHYWSLSVETQFYLVWPLLVLVVVLAWARYARARHGHARVGRNSLQVWLTVAFAAVFAASLAESVRATATDPGTAYFATTTRVWELALGGILAVAAPWLRRLPAVAAAGLGWLGVAAIGYAVAAYSSTTAFPGHAALLPTLGAAGIIACGATAGRKGPALLLDTAPLRFVGALSYSIYLWHWPLLTLAEARYGPMPVAASVCVALASVLPAWLTYRLVENPVRRDRRWHRTPAAALRSGVLATGATVAAVLIFLQLFVWPTAWRATTVDTLAAGTAAAAGERIGAEVLRDPPGGDRRGAPVDRVARLLPDTTAIRLDVPESYARKCHQDDRGDAPLRCEYGHRTGRFTVALVGDSHATQWVPALEGAATRRHWRLITYTKSACPFAAMEVAHPVHKPYDTCLRWNGNVLAKLLADPPDLVVVSGSSYEVVRDGEILGAGESVSASAEGLRSHLRALTAASVPVVVLRDTPHPHRDLAECVSAHRNRLTACAYDRASSEGGADQLAAVQGMAGVRLVDLSDAICPTDPCAAVIGRVVVYRDSNHLSATYARTLADRLGDALVARKR